MRKVLIVFILAGLAVVSWKAWQFYGQKTPRVKYRLIKTELRDLTKSISATGTMSAVITVAVGSEISGQIKELLADYNDRVAKNQVIARISSDKYQALVYEAEAALALSRTQLPIQKATVERYKADINNALALLDAARSQTTKARATLENTRREFERSRPLLAKGIIPKADYESAETALAEAEAQVELSQSQEGAAASNVISSQATLAMARAQIKEVAAQIELKKAALHKYRVDLDNTVIRSPIDGVIIDRSVDVGQTVAASLQAPTLFTIAQDLKQMQVAASVDEADIGSIRPGQPAHFTVDAFGGRKFEGRVSQVRMAGQTVQNVVTYTVIISVNNVDLSLMPGMTADVEIELLKRPQVLTVANSALRFTPPKAQPSSATTTKVSTGNNPQTGSGGGRAAIEARIKEYTEHLALSESQQDELKKIFQQNSQKMKTARKTTSTGPRESISAMRDKIRKESQVAILRILNTEQQKLFAEMAAQEKPKRDTLWRLDDRGQPEAIPVMLGSNDTSHTEISGRGIEAGMQVIYGIE